jgi:hypothetical protein
MAEIANGYFPDLDVQWDVQIGRRYKTQIKESVSGIEQRRRLYPAASVYGTGHKGGYGFVSATSDMFTPEERQQVADFLDAADGAFKAFYYWRRDRDIFTNYFVGNVASASTIIIPFKDVSVTSVTVNNVSKTFSVTENLGLGGEAQVTFLAGVQTGAVRITCRGRERWLVRALNDDVVTTFVANAIKDNAVFPLAFKQVR